MKIGILGSGMVGQALAAGFVKEGWEVMVGSNHPEKLAEFERTNPQVKPGTFAEAADFGEVVVLSVKGSAAEAVLRDLPAAKLAGKVVIDTTNPIADAPPENGVLKFFTNLDESLMERLQKLAPQAHFVKAFNSVGAAAMIHPDFGGLKPTMFICGNDKAAKVKVTSMLDTLGWEVEDMGEVEGARAIEPLCMLWCIPGMLRNQWTHAFKLLKNN
jgi:predicted dinucleotide-binding enzyme